MRAFALDRAVQASSTRTLAILFPLMLLGACETLPPPVDSAVLQERVDAEPRLPDAPRYIVDPNASEVRLLVYREGPLARFGHNHVISGPVRGEIRAGNSAADSGFHLEIPVTLFTVDSPAARVEEGEAFASEVSDEARAATRDNMLGKELLDAENMPIIEIDSISLTGPRWNPTVLARTRLRGATRDLRFPAGVVEHDGELAVVASLRIRHSDFGLTPFSTLGGGLRVSDGVDIRLRVIARRTSREAANKRPFSPPACRRATVGD